MNQLEKIKLIEKALDGAGNAARAAGVTLTSWGRWKHTGKLDGDRSGLSRAVIDLLFEKHCSHKKAATQ